MKDTSYKMVITIRMIIEEDRIQLMTHLSELFYYHNVFSISVSHYSQKQRVETHIIDYLHFNEQKRKR